MAVFRQQKLVVVAGARLSAASGRNGATIRPSHESLYQTIQLIAYIKAVPSCVGLALYVYVATVPVHWLKTFGLDPK